MKNSIRSFTVSVTTPTILITLLAGPALADDDVNIQVPPAPDAYAQLSAEWWRWAFDDFNFTAVNDLTGESCDLNQPDSGIWFLAGTFGVEDVVRTCTIPANRQLFFPLLNSAVGGPFPDQATIPTGTLTISDLRDFASGGIVPGSSAEPPLEITLDGSIDGIPLRRLVRRANLGNFANESELRRGSLFNLRTQSEVFSLPGYEEIVEIPLVIGDDPDIPFPVPNVFAGDGYYVLVKPLSPGQHVIEFSATRTGAGDDFALSVTYLLTVLDDDDNGSDARNATIEAARPSAPMELRREQGFFSIPTLMNAPASGSDSR